MPSRYKERKGKMREFIGEIPNEEALNITGRPPIFPHLLTDRAVFGQVNDIEKGTEKPIKKRVLCDSLAEMQRLYDKYNGAVRWISGLDPKLH